MPGKRTNFIYKDYLSWSWPVSVYWGGSTLIGNGSSSPWSLSYVKCLEKKIIKKKKVNERPKKEKKRCSKKKRKEKERKETLTYHYISLSPEF